MQLTSVPAESTILTFALRTKSSAELIKAVSSESACSTTSASESAILASGSSRQDAPEGTVSETVFFGRSYQRFFTKDAAYQASFIFLPISSSEREGSRNMVVDPLYFTPSFSKSRKISALISSRSLYLGRSSFFFIKYNSTASVRFRVTRQAETPAFSSRLIILSISFLSELSVRLPFSHAALSRYQAMPYSRLLPAAVHSLSRAPSQPRRMRALI